MARTMQPSSCQVSDNAPELFSVKEVLTYVQTERNLICQEPASSKKRLHPPLSISASPDACRFSPLLGVKSSLSGQEGRAETTGHAGLRSSAPGKGERWCEISLFHKLTEPWGHLQSQPPSAAAQDEQTSRLIGTPS